MPSPTQGWILLCNNSTEQEYIRNNLVGLKEQYLPRLASLEPGDPVLLYNFESAHLAALFFATGKPALDIAAQGWFKRYRAQVPVRLEIQFEPPISREQLQTIPDLYFDGNGYLVNFAIPLQVVLGITDMAAGRKRPASEPAENEEVDYRPNLPRKLNSHNGKSV